MFFSFQIVRIIGLFLFIINVVHGNKNGHLGRVKVKIYDHRAEHDPKEQYGRGPWNYYGYGYGLEYQFEPNGSYERQKGYGYVRAYGRDFCKFADKSKCPEHVRQYARDKYSGGNNKLEPDMLFLVPPMMPNTESSKVPILSPEPLTEPVQKGPTLQLANQQPAHQLPRSLLLNNIVKKSTTDANGPTHTIPVQTSYEYKNGRIPVSNFRPTNKAESLQTQPSSTPAIYDLIASPLYPLPPPSIGYTNVNKSVQDDLKANSLSKVVLDRSESGQNLTRVQDTLIDQLQPRSSSSFFFDDNKTKGFQEPPLKLPNSPHPPNKLVRQSPQVMLLEFENEPIIPLQPSQTFSNFDDSFNNRERDFFSPKIPPKEEKYEEDEETAADADDEEEEEDNPKRRMFTGHPNKKINGSKKQKKLLMKSASNFLKPNEVAGRPGATSVLPLIKAIYPAFARS